MMWVKVEEDGSIKSSVSKFYTEDELRAWTDRAGAKPGDLMLIEAFTFSRISPLRKVPLPISTVIPVQVEISSFS